MPILLKKIEFLKYIIGRSGIRVNLTKITAAKKWLILISIKEIQFFFEFINFNRNFIKKYSGYAESLTQLIKK